MPQHVLEALKKLLIAHHNQPLKGLILDLRNNPGGLLHAGVDVANTFLDAQRLSKQFPKLNHVIVNTQGRRHESNMISYATPGDALTDIPIVVLINHGSASASEIVAGALKDYQRAIILGRPSFGKGSVQTILPLDQNSAIKLTTALYYTPRHHCIQAQGIEPDILLPENTQLSQPTLPTNSRLEDLAQIQEANLPGHLEPSSHKRNASPNNPLITKDLFVFTALHILQGIHALHQH